MQSVAYLKQLIQLFTDYQHRATRFAQGQQLTANLRRCAHIHAPGGLRNDQQLRLGIHLAPDNKFLQIATGQRVRRRTRTTGFDLELANQPLGVVFQ